LFSKEQARLALCYSHYRQNISFLKRKIFNARIFFSCMRKAVSQPAGVHPKKPRRAFGDRQFNSRATLNGQNTFHSAKDNYT